MKNSIALFALLLTSSVALPAAAAWAADAPQPMNLLIITADDMNADSGGWNGSTLGATPNLDAFAKSAHRFVNSHVTVPICQPGRSALMTGRVPHRNGALGFNPIKRDVPTLVGGNKWVRTEWHCRLFCIRGRRAARGRTRESM